MFVIGKSCFFFEKLACIWARCCICYCKELILFVLFCFVGDFNLPSSGQGVICHCKELDLFVCFVFVGDYNLPASGQGVVFVVVSPFPGKRLQTAKNIFKTNSNLEKTPKWNPKKNHDDATFCFFEVEE